MIHPFQIVVLAALVAGTAIYIWRGVKQRIRADEEFFKSLVVQVAWVLQPKGFELTRDVYYRESFGHRTARFESAATVVDVELDGRERDVRLLRRPIIDRDASTYEVVATTVLGFAPSAATYARATDLIVAASASLDYAD